MHLRRLFVDTFAGRFSQDAFARELVAHRVLDPEPNHEVLARVLDGVKAMLPAAADARVDHSWAGYIDMAPDMLPTLDRLERPAGLVLATGSRPHRPNIPGIELAGVFVFRDLRDAGGRSDPPSSYADQFRAFRKGNKPAGEGK